MFHTSVHPPHLCLPPSLSLVMTVNCLLIHPSILHLSEQPPLQFPPLPTHPVPVFLFAVSQPLTQSAPVPLPHLIQYIFFLKSLPHFLPLFTSLHLATPPPYAALPPLFSVHPSTASIFPLFFSSLFTRGLILPSSRLPHSPSSASFSSSTPCFHLFFYLFHICFSTSTLIHLYSCCCSFNVWIRPCLSSHHHAPPSFPLPLTIFSGFFLSPPVFFDSIFTERP